VSPPKTISRMDAGFEPPWMGSRRVFGGHTQLMSRCQCVIIKPLLTTDINRKHLAETHREPTCTDAGNVDIAGANIYHPWGLDIRIPAADGLSKVLPIHVSRLYLWDSSGFKSLFITRR